MATATTPRRRSPQASPPSDPPETVADLLRRLGNIPARRVRLHPTPGTATESDLIKENENKLRTGLYELVDATLVEKGMGYEESAIAMLIAIHLGNFIVPRKLGILTGEAGTMRTTGSQVRARRRLPLPRPLPRRQAAQGPDRPDRTRPGRRGPEQVEHQGRDRPQAPRVFCLGDAARLDRRPEDEERPRPHGADRLDPTRPRLGRRARRRRRAAGLPPPAGRSVRDPGRVSPDRLPGLSPIRDPHTIKGTRRDGTSPVRAAFASLSTGHVLMRTLITARRIAPLFIALAAIVHPAARAAEPTPAKKDSKVPRPPQATLSAKVVPAEARPGDTVKLTVTADVAPAGISTPTTRASPTTARRSPSSTCSTPPG